MEQVTLQKKAKSSIRNQVRLFSILLIFFVSGFLKAQNVIYTAEESRNPWFIGLGAGPRIYFADHARQLNLNERITGGADIYFGKWWGPYFGSRLGGSWQVLKGATKYSMNSRIGNVINPGHAIENEFFLRDHKLYRQQFNAWHVYADLLFNVSNFFQGMNHDRFWTLTPFVGLGLMSTWDEPSTHEISLNAGLLNKLRVSNNVDLIFDIRGAAFRDRFKNPIYDPNADREKYPNRLNNDTDRRPFDGLLSVNLGVAFKFGGNGNPKPVYYPITYIDPVPPPPPVNTTTIEVVTEWKDVAADVLILFRIGQSTLSQDARVQLGFLAKLMQQYPESSYTITGYADEGTGSADLNYRLSNERAARVKDCLVGEFGIAASRLKTAGVGGIENRYYNDPSLSRSVIIRPDRY